MATDYNKLTVANLRQLLKDRGIPSTGLTRKAQIVEKLEEQDSVNNDAPQDESAEADPAAQEPHDNTAEVQEKEPLLTESKDTPDQGPTETHAPPEPSALPDTTTTVVDNTTEIIPQPDQAQEQAQTIPSQEEVQNVVVEPTVPVAKTPPPPETDREQNEVSEIPAPQTTHTHDFAVAEPRTASPDPNEKPSVEKPELLPIPERSTNTSVEVSRMNTEELEADSRKRKRRSQSPDLSTQEVKAKKPRASEEAVHLQEDKDVVMDQRQPEISEVVEKNLNDDTNAQSEANENKKDNISDTGKEGQESPSHKAEVATTKTDGRPTGTEKKEKDDRYREAFTKAIPRSPEPALSADLADDDRPMVPALHAATPAIYIKDFMRPLRVEPLRTHLISLASPPSSTADPSILESLYLDPMRTHAFVLFANTKAASRVRSSLHGTKWPPEGQRRELWVDFVPEDKVLSWIASEEDATAAEKESRAMSRPIPAKRFEVLYPESEEGEIQAIFQEVGANLNTSFNPPRGPRSNIEQRRKDDGAPTTPHQPTRNEEIRKDLGKSFQTLDQLFKSTTAKPKLYYLPVSEEISERRLNELHDVTHRDWRPEDKVRGRGADASRADEKVRYSFGEDGKVIEVGRDTNVISGRGGWGGPRGGRRGGFRSEGGGGGWRGGRGGFRSERRFD